MTKTYPCPNNIEPDCGYPACAHAMQCENAANQRKMEYITRITKMTVLPEGKPIFSEQATQIEIVNEEDGEFLKITQEPGNSDYEGAVCIDPNEWPSIKATIETMLEDIKRHEHPTE
jgi:hypothetical protein